MGAYKSKPVTEKCSHYGSNDFITYAASSMQGWRTQQEDAHNCMPDFDTARLISLFAVYDGHGGSEVARYCASNLPKFLKELQAYKDSQPSKALEQLFLDFDASLAMPETRSVLQSMMDKDGEYSDKEAKKSEAENSDDSETDENEELTALQDEAEQPLESVLERYGGKNALPISIKTLLDARQGGMEDEAPAVPSTSKNSGEKESEGAVADTGADKSDKTAENDPKPPRVNCEEQAGETSPNSIGTGKIADEKRTEPEKVGDVDEEDEDSSDESVTLEELQNAKREVEDDDEEEVEGDSESDEDDEDSSDEEDDDDEDDDDDQEPLSFPLPITDQEEPGVDSGTTACVAVVMPMASGVVRLFVANAGDSRAVLCRGGAAVDLSVDHKPEDEDEKARILAAGGMVTRDGRVNGGLNLSRALGDHSYKQVEGLPLSEQMITPLPDISQFDLVPGADEFMVIACDGVWNSMTSQDVVSFVYDRLHPSSSSSAEAGATEKKEAGVDTSKDSVKLKEICEELFDQCLAPNTEGDGTGCDNMTCIIVRFDDLPGLSRRLAEQTRSEEVMVDKRPVEKTKRAAADPIDADAIELTAVVAAATAKRTRQDSQTTPSDGPLIAVANGGGTL